MTVVEQICRRGQQVVNAHLGPWPPADYDFDQAIRDAIVETAGAYAAIEQIIRLYPSSTTQLEDNARLVLPAIRDNYEAMMCQFNRFFPDHVRRALEEKGK